MHYKSKIFKVVNLLPLEGDDVRQGMPVKELVDKKAVGPVMHVIQIAGTDALVNYAVEGESHAASAR